MASPTLNPPPVEMPLDDQRRERNGAKLISSEWLRWINALYLYVITAITELYRQIAVSSTAVSMSLTDSIGVLLVTATGQTITLPAASTARIGKVWRVIFRTTGTCTVVCAGSDTMPLPSSATETTVVMNLRGMSLDFECETATTWSIV